MKDNDIANGILRRGLPPNKQGERKLSDNRRARALNRNRRVIELPDPVIGESISEPADTKIRPDVIGFDL